VTLLVAHEDANYLFICVISSYMQYLAIFCNPPPSLYYHTTLTTIYKDHLKRLPFL